MTRPQPSWPATTVPSLLAALTSWVALWSWTGFVQSPSGFLVPTLGGVLLVAVAGMLLRSARWPVVLVLLGQAAVVTLWLTHRWAADQALGGWLPTPAAFTEIGAVLNQSALAAQEYAAPVSDEAPEIFALLILAGTATALLVDFLACGLRRVPVAGLPLLAVYTAPVSILGEGVPWWGFAAGALAFLTLLSDEEGRRLAQWGRQVPDRERLYDSVGSRVSMATVRDSARKIGFTATGLAVVAPLVIPTLGSSILPGTGPGSGGDGDSVTISNPLVDLRRDLVRGADIDLVRIRTDDPAPSYLRISVLDEFNGTTWKPTGRDIPDEQRAAGRLPVPPGLSPDVARTEVEYSLSVADEFSSLWLPAPYPVRTIEVEGDWRYDRSTYDFVSARDDQTTSGLEYDLTALVVQPSATDLTEAPVTPDDVAAPNTDLPDDLPTLVRTLARQVTAGMPTRFARAVALQRWFRDPANFTYSLRREAGNGTDDLVQFLGTGPGSRVGYCEQFAAAMAVMGRALGIPSRVAVGFLSPEPVGDGSYVYSAHDLHAWPEMYFEGTGWVRFEPTPQDRASDVPGYTRGRLDVPEPADIPTDAVPEIDPEQLARDRQQEEADAAAAGGGGNDTPWGLIAVVVLLPLAVTGPRLARSGVRRRRWSSAETPAELADAAWRELRDVAVDLGLPWDDTVTLRTRARDLVALFGSPASPEADPTGGGLTYAHAGRGAGANPEATHALERLVTDLERARYSREMTARPGADRMTAEADVALCERALRDGASPRRRAMATWLPASLVRNREWRLPARIGRPGAAIVEPGVDRAT